MINEWSVVHSVGMRVLDVWTSKATEERRFDKQVWRIANLLFMKWVQIKEYNGISKQEHKWGVSKLWSEWGIKIQREARNSQCWSVLIGG